MAETRLDCLSFGRKQTKFFPFRLALNEMEKIIQKRAVFRNLGCTENDAH